MHTLQTELYNYCQNTVRNLFRGNIKNNDCVVS
jgi:hypothetical protein